MALLFSDRFKDAPWLKEGILPKVLIVGLGGIGSHTGFILSKTVPFTHLYLVDHDVVDQYNVGTQFYFRPQIGKRKTTALHSMLAQVQPSTSIYITSERIEDINMNWLDYDIIIIAVDSIKVRKYIINAIKKDLDKYVTFDPSVLPLVIDGRLNATSYEVFTISGVSPDESISNRRYFESQLDAYKSSLIDEESLGEGSCTMKQTYFFGAMIGARIVNIITNYLSNLAYKKQCVSEDKPFIMLYEVPFHIREIGDAMLLVKEDAEEYKKKMISYKKEE